MMRLENCANIFMTHNTVEFFKPCKEHSTVSYLFPSTSNLTLQQELYKTKHLKKNSGISHAKLALGFIA